ncbi:SDR family NAD(P)-dependent oxidoreductase [Streptomyces mirabilis]
MKGQGYARVRTIRTTDRLAARMAGGASHRVPDAGLTGIFSVVNPMLPKMLRARRGPTAPTSSAVALHGGNAQPNSAASRRGIPAPGRSLTTGRIHRNVSVSVVASGPSRTDLTGALNGDLRSNSAWIPDGCLAQPTRSAHTAHFAAGPARMQGAIVRVDGDAGPGY